MKKKKPKSKGVKKIRLPLFIRSKVTFKHMKK